MSNIELDLESSQPVDGARIKVIGSWAAAGIMRSIE